MSTVQFKRNSGLQGNIFSLYNTVKFEDKRKVKDVKIQLGSAEYRAYQSVILEPKPQCQLDHLRQLHILDKLEDGYDSSWECIKVLKYAKERTAVDGVYHRHLLEWNDLNKSKSLLKFFVVCLNNPTPIISLAREHTLLNKPPFFNLIPYCISKPYLNMSKNTMSQPV
jgi:hypothetical protein